MPSTFEMRARAELERRLTALLRGHDRLIVGPFLSEVGPELLYWAPFARWVVNHFGLDPANVTVISRGGVASWYEGVGDTYVDVFDVYKPAEFQRMWDVRGRGLGGQKQTRETYWDTEILRASADRTGWTPGTPILHPAMMFRFFRRFWKGGLSTAQVLDHIEYRKLHTAVPADIDLPSDYIAVGFYFRSSFPDTPANRAFVDRTVAKLCDATTVVLLDTGVSADEHVRATVSDPRALRPLEGAHPSRNLALQSAVVAQSRVMVGTYGGLTYVAPAQGVDAISFATEMAENLPSHLDASRRLGAVGGGNLTLLPTEGFEAIGALR